MLGFGRWCTVIRDVQLVVLASTVRFHLFFFFFGGMDIHYTSATIATSRLFFGVPFVGVWYILLWTDRRVILTRPVFHTT